jgi:hypothetical protein
MEDTAAADVVISSYADDEGSMESINEETEGGLTTIKIVASQHTLANLPSLSKVVRERKS